MLRGAVSWGHSQCRTDHFTVFARVSSFISWINDKKSGKLRKPTKSPAQKNALCSVRNVEKLIQSWFQKNYHERVNYQSSLRISYKTS